MKIIPNKSLLERKVWIKGHEGIIKSVRNCGIIESVKDCTDRMICRNCPTSLEVFTIDFIDRWSESACKGWCKSVKWNSETNEDTQKQN